MRTTGRKSFRLLMVFFGTRMMVEDFRQGGTVACAKDRLNILVKTPVSWTAQSFSTLPVTPSGSAAFLGFTVLSMNLTSSGNINRDTVCDPNGLGGVLIWPCTSA